MTAAPEVSVIIPAAGDRRPLVACLQALEAQSIARERFEVIVVDNGCDPPAGDLADGERRIVLTEPESGSYRARNRGLARARGSLLLFTDADCVPARDWIERMITQFDATPDVSIVAGAIEVSVDPAHRTAAEVIELRFGFPQEAYVRGSGFGATANLAVRRESFDVAGPFDPGLLSGGDAEWCWRAGDAGLSIAFEPRAVVRHPARRTSEELLRKERRVSRGLCALRRAGRLPARVFRGAVLGAMLPPVISAAAVLSDRSTGPITARLRAIPLLARLRFLRLRVLLACLTGR